MMSADPSVIRALAVLPGPGVSPERAAEVLDAIAKELSELPCPLDLEPLPAREVVMRARQHAIGAATGDRRPATLEAVLNVYRIADALIAGRRPEWGEAIDVLVRAIRAPDHMPLPPPAAFRAEPAQRTALERLLLAIEAFDQRYRSAAGGVRPLDDMRIEAMRLADEADKLLFAGAGRDVIDGLRAEINGTADVLFRTYPLDETLKRLYVLALLYLDPSGDRVRQELGDGLDDGPSFIASWRMRVALRDAADIPLPSQGLAEGRSLPPLPVTRREPSLAERLTDCVADLCRASSGPPPWCDEVRLRELLVKTAGIARRLELPDPVVRGLEGWSSDRPSEQLDVLRVLEETPRAIKLIAAVSVAVLAADRAVKQAACNVLDLGGGVSWQVLIDFLFRLRPEWGFLAALRLVETYDGLGCLVISLSVSHALLAELLVHRSAGAVGAVARRHVALLGRHRGAEEASRFGDDLARKLESLGLHEDAQQVRAAVAALVTQAPPEPVAAPAAEVGSPRAAGGTDEAAAASTPKAPPVVRLELVRGRGQSKPPVIFDSDRVFVSEGHFEVFKELAYSHAAGIAGDCKLPTDPDVRKRFQTRLSDLRNPHSARIPKPLREALLRYDTALIDPKRPRLNPALRFHIIAP